MENKVISKEYVKQNYIHKDVIREIVYPRPDNCIPIEVQTSEMYKKLIEKLEDK